MNFWLNGKFIETGWLKMNMPFYFRFSAFTQPPCSGTHTEHSDIPHASLALMQNSHSVPTGRQTPVSVARACVRACVRGCLYCTPKCSSERMCIVRLRMSRMDVMDVRTTHTRSSAGKIKSGNNKYILRGCKMCARICSFFPACALRTFSEDGSSAVTL